MKLPRPDSQKWSQRLRDPFWQFAGVVVALGALVVSVFVAYDVIQRTNERPKLEGVISRKYPIIDLDAEELEDIEVYYLGERARVVSSFFFTIENLGDSAVRPEDYYPGPPIISVEGSGQIAKVAITDRQPESIDLEVSQVSTNTFQLSGALLNPHDRVEFQVILIDEDDPWSEAILKQTSGRIVGAEDIQFRQGDEPKILSFASNYFSFPFYELLILALLAVVLFYVILRYSRHRYPQQWVGSQIEAKIVIMASMSVIAVFWTAALVISIASNNSARWWRIWTPAAIMGGLLVVAYFLWIVRMARRNSNRQLKDHNSTDRNHSSEQELKSNDS